MRRGGAVSTGSGARHWYQVAAITISAFGVLYALALPSGARADAMTLDVNLSPTSLTIEVDGSTVASGSTVAAGCYIVSVDNSYEEDAGMGAGYPPAPGLEIMGPGVDLPPNSLSSQQMGLDELAEASFGPYVFQSGGAYTIEDTTSSLSVNFTATGSGSTSCALTSGGGSTVSGSGTTMGSTTSMASTTSTAATKVIGKIDTTVSASGELLLVLDGHPVRTLKPGRYTFVIEDHSHRAGLIIGEGSETHLTLSGAAFVGKVTRSITFSEGTWYVESTVHGPKRSLTVG
jgi:hypothetical protein